VLVVHRAPTFGHLMSVAIIINPVSGKSEPDLARRRAAMALSVLAHCGETGEAFVTERLGHARELAAAAVVRGARLVVAWGGDGTVNEVASALAFGPAALGIVPAGSGNGLARTLGVAARPERALAEALGARPRVIDAGELGGRMFFSVAGAGFDAHVASCFGRDPAGRRGLARYVRIAARELLTYDALPYRIDGGQAGIRSCRALLVTLANASQFGNGACIAPGAQVDDGWLELVVVEERSLLRTIGAIPRLFTGGIARLSGVSIQRIAHATIESDRPLTFHVDGEVVQGAARLDAQVHRAALRVCVR
jgi:diacylglycerol kinase family enzyme